MIDSIIIAQQNKRIEDEKKKKLKKQKLSQLKNNAQFITVNIENIHEGKFIFVPMMLNVNLIQNIYAVYWNTGRKDKYNTVIELFDKTYFVKETLSEIKLMLDK